MKQTNTLCRILWVLFYLAVVVAWSLGYPVALLLDAALFQFPFALILYPLLMVAIAILSVAMIKTAGKRSVKISLISVMGSTLLLGSLLYAALVYVMNHLYSRF